LRHEQNVMNFIYPAGKEPAGPAAREAASNVFVLKCIVAQQDFPLPRLFNAMVAMFGAYPDRDYCMMVMNAKNKANKSYLEVLQYFIRNNTGSDGGQCVAQCFFEEMNMVCCSRMKILL